MGPIVCIFAFAGAVALSRKTLGNGLGFALAVGSCYGWLRGNFPDGLARFCFDAALGGLYLSVLPRVRFRSEGRPGSLRTWTVLLMAWPLIIILISPFLEAQHVLVQIAGLRNAVLFVPLILVGSLLGPKDWSEVSAWAEWCVVGVSVVAIGEVVFGLEPFFPLNDLTQNIYRSNDIVGGFYRIPATFSSAHAYGGTMVALIPLLLARLEEARPSRWLTFVALALAALGVFACGARLPVVLFSCVVAGSLLQLRKRPVVLLLLIIGMAAVGYSVSQSSRLRRFESLADPELVSERVAGSVNMNFWDILSDYPMGKGLGSAFGTSVPTFLAEYARPPVGIESEYGRLLLEEGLPGLLLWVFFVGSLLGSSAATIRRRGTRAVGMWLVCALTWASGLIGAGLLAAIPATMLVMLYFGEIGKGRHAATAARDADRARARLRALGRVELFSDHQAGSPRLRGEPSMMRQEVRG